MAFFDFMKLILELLIGFMGFTVLMGLIQPWWVLWWTSKQNRMLVLKYYGIPWLLLLAIWLVLIKIP